jgi:hypothetical protein
MNVIQQAKGQKPERKYAFQVSFSLHCFSRKILKNEQDLAYCYSDSRETRFFCHNRYELSKKLPEIIREISHKKCCHTGHGNFFIVEIITADGNRQDYEVYFAVTKGKNNRLNLFIQSAYIRDDKHQQRKRKKTIGFYIIAFNKLNNKQIKIPR